MKDNEEDTMEQFFSKNIDISTDTSINKEQAIDYGQGFAIGVFGSYESYARSLSLNGQDQSVYIGKDINMDTLSIIDQITEFTIGDIPKILVRLTNIANGMLIKALWQDEGGNVILESSYGIPAPYTKRYDWWSTYLVIFKGPENLGEGKYQVNIMSKNIRNKDISATIEFTISSPIIEDNT